VRVVLDNPSQQAAAQQAAEADLPRLIIITDYDYELVLINNYHRNLRTISSEILA
jgi:hypothetical protein